MATRPIQQFKTCRKCGVEKPASTEFFVKKLEGLTSQCKPCLQARKREVWAANAEQINLARRASRDADIRQREREYYARNACKIAAQQIARNRANPERKKELDAQSYQRHAAKRRRQAREWAANNPDQKRRNNREFYRRKRATDPAYRLRSSVSALVYFHLKRGKGGKRTEEILGYSIADLRQHLERQFLPGMSWQNYGDWHVDHILPVASFNFDSADHPDFRACWALTNLRPLWAADNIAKSDKRTHLI